MRVFVTVGSTQFDELVKTVLSRDFLRVIRQRGYHLLTIQCGKFGTDLGIDKEGTLLREEEGVQVEIWRYKSSLADDISEADLIISHAGSGTILEVLRKGKPLIVVPNPTLLDNHQEDLATELEKMGYLKASSPSQLVDAISSFNASSLAPFPSMEPSRFRDIIDRELGFL